MHDFSSRHGEFRTRRRSDRGFNDDDPATAKRVRGRRALPSIEQFDATDGLLEVDRWSTWDQTKSLIPNDVWTGRARMPSHVLGFGWPPALAGTTAGQPPGSRTPTATQPPTRANCLP